MIRKTRGKDEWVIFSESKDPKTGKRKRLGSYSSRKAAEKRLRQIEHFKSQD